MGDRPRYCARQRTTAKHVGKIKGLSVAHIIVVGNEKGGAGKSTVSMHVSTALARMGHRVGALDLDLRQKASVPTDNRAGILAGESGSTCPGRIYMELPEVDPAALQPGENAYDHRLSAAVAELEKTSDFILIDCPGSHTRLRRSRIRWPTRWSRRSTTVSSISTCWPMSMPAATRSRARRSIRRWSGRHGNCGRRPGLKPIDWIVLRNRLGAQNMVNKMKMEQALERLAKRIGFRIAPGFSERVVFRELFPRGLTLLDLKDVGVKQLNISNVAARQELRDLIKALDLPGVEVRF